MKNLMLLIFIFILISVRCDTTEPPLPKASLSLTLEDVSCTEAWITLKPNNLNLPATVTLYKNSVAQNNILCYGDTLLYIDSLLPKQTYKFQSFSQSSNQSIVSNELSVTTMDTTSHNFTWQTFTFGEHSSSVLYDVAIINENNIWAVGEIYMKDSLGNNDPYSYNAIYWNGTKWELRRIGNQGGWACHTVFAFSSTDIWFEGNIHWDGTSYKVYKNGWPLMPNGDGWQVNKMWGSSSNDLYAVGNGGNIAHYSNGSWRKIESGTDVNLLDVYGTPDGSVVWACGYHYAQHGTYLLRYGGSGWEMAYDGTQSEFIIRSDSLSGAYTSLYTASNKNIYVASSAGVYRAPWNTHGEAKRLSFTSTWFPGFPQRIRGAEARDWFVVGAFNFIAHYNGSTWRHYSELMHGDGRLRSVSQRGNCVVAVGYSYHPIHSRAIVFRGRR